MSTALKAGFAIHHLLGTICVPLPGQMIDRLVGRAAIGMDCGVPRNGEALEESALLLTITWPEGRIRDLMRPVPSARPIRFS